MKVREIMTPAVVSVREDTPYKEIAETLIDNDVSAVPVVDQSGWVIGIVTEADLLAKEAYPGAPKKGLRALIADIVSGRDLEFLYKAQATKAWEVMTPRIVSAEPDEDLHAAARRMLEHRVKRLVVIDEGKPVGVISRSDIVEVLARSDRELQDRIDRFLTRCGFVPPAHTIRTKVSDGMVTLEGSVAYESDIGIAGSMIEALDGVVSVDNSLLYRFPDPTRETVKPDRA